MATNVSNLIEQFILQNLTDGILEISRNDLAEYFSVAPSQINYVLSTRFTPSKGYIIESHRGGGGYVKVIQVNLNANQYLKTLLTTYISAEMSYADSVTILSELLKRELISQREFCLLKSAISPKSLACPVKVDDKIRSNILKNVILQLLGGNNDLWNMWKKSGNNSWRNRGAKQIFMHSLLQKIC